MSEIPSEPSLVTIALMGKTLLHCVSPNIPTLIGRLNVSNLIEHRSSLGGGGGY